MTSTGTPATQATPYSTPSVLQTVMREQRLLRDKQDIRLRTLLRLAGGIPTIFLTTGTVAIAVSGELAAVSAIIVIIVAILVVLIMIPVEGHANR